ncbi:MAG TPA: chloride channel protein [Fibrobacteria bacterium]|nr:chloride channel protein [Fibrobacteria bacterium]
MIRLSLKRFRHLTRWVFFHKPRQSLAELGILWRVQVLLRLLPRESTRAFAATLVLGAVCGLVTVAFHGSLEWASYKVGFLLREIPSPYGAFGIILVPALAAWLAGILLVRSRLPAAGSGIPQVKAALAGLSPVHGIRVGVVKFALCVIQVGGGASLGREGPTVQICAALAPPVLKLFALPKAFLRRFLPVAAAAGIAAAFNTPIAAVTFAMEELMGSSTPTAMTGLVVAAAIAAILEKLLLGGHPLFSAPAWTFDSLASLPSFLILGILGGFLGVLFHRWLLDLRARFQSLRRLSIPLQMALGGLITGVAIWIGTAFLGNDGIAGPGYALLEASLHEHLSHGQTLGLLPLKFMATLASYCSGGVGGIFSPVLAIGSLLGSLVGWLQRDLPWADATPLGAFALVGMGTFFASVIQAPITSVLILFELTGNYGLIIPLMLANMASFLIARKMNPVPIYDALLLQDGVDLHGSTESHQLTVGDLCDGEIVRFPSSTRVYSFWLEGGSLPCIVEEADGTCLGLVDEVPDSPDPDLMLRDFLRSRVSLREKDPVFPALSLLSQQGHPWLPVVDKSGKAVGIFGTREALARLSEDGYKTS